MRTDEFIGTARIVSINSCRHDVIFTHIEFNLPRQITPSYNNHVDNHNKPVTDFYVGSWPNTHLPGIHGSYVRTEYGKFKSNRHK